jgi:hypothetical protein
MNANSRWSILPAGEYRSRSEQWFAEWLDSYKIRWSYEPECVVLPDGTKYVPDFLLPDGPIYVEVKPAIYRGELLKWRAFCETLVGTTAHCWAVEVVNRKPVPIEVCQIISDEDSEEIGFGLGSSRGADFGFEDECQWVFCSTCGKPYVFHYNQYCCHHCWEHNS